MFVLSNANNNTMKKCDRSPSHHYHWKGNELNSDADVVGPVYHNVTEWGSCDCCGAKLILETSNPEREVDANIWPVGRRRPELYMVLCETCFGHACNPENKEEFEGYVNLKK